MKDADQNLKLSRRAVMVAGIAGATAHATGCTNTDAQNPATTVAQSSSTSMKATMTEPMPVLYLPHGGGPFSFVDLGLPPEEVDALAGYWAQVGRRSPRPRAVLIISAHWEERVPTVMSAARPGMLYDYYNFPPASYEIQYPAPGAPDVAKRVQSLLGTAGFETAEDKERGYDHGTFIPLKRVFPDADIPVVQLSLVAGLDAETHLRMGRALAPLRAEGILIVGSGMSFHNLRAVSSPNANAAAEAFDTWMKDAVTADSATRDATLQKWEAAPHARSVHPREEHLIPLMVAAGAAGETQGTIDWSGKLLGKAISAVAFA